jgi:hypothetical protein
MGMNQSTIINSIRDLLNTSQHPLVIIGPNPSLDILAASTSFHLALSEADKEVAFAAPQQPKIDYSELTGVNRLVTEISNKNLIISFDYEPSAVEKVNYHIGQETNRFYLTIEPQKNHPPLDKDTIEINYAGVDADLIFLFGVRDYEVLGTLYLGNEQLFADTNVVTVHSFEPEIGQLKLTTDGELNYSGLITYLVQELNLPLSADAATNLLLSLEAETNHFQSFSTTPKVFEQAAWLMRQGARRIRPLNKTSQVKPKVVEAQPTS